MRDTIIHPDMLDKLYRFYDSDCTIQRASITYDTFGGEVFAWANLAGHVGLACAIAPVDSSPKEITAPDQTYVVASHHVTLAGYYPTINEKDRAVVTNTDGDILTLDVLLVESDSQSDSTRMNCQLVE